jgi:hypothetical protein
MITRRIRKLRANVEINAQNLRENALESLKELFNMEKNLAKKKTSNSNKDKPGRA